MLNTSKLRNSSVHLITRTMSAISQRAMVVGYLVAITLLVSGFQAVTASDSKASEPMLSTSTKSPDEKYQLAKSLLKNPSKTQLERAYHWFSEASTDGHAAAQYELAMMILRKQTAYHNRDVAMDWLDRAANQGYVDAMWELARLFEGAKGLRSNKMNAYVWYQLAKEFGKTNATVAVKRAVKRLNLSDKADAQLIFMKKKRKLKNERAKKQKALDL